MHLETMDRVKLAHQRVQRKVALRRNPIPHPRCDIRQFATPRIALSLGIQTASLAPQLDHVVHKTRRNPEVTCCLSMRVALIDERDDPFPKFHRMWLTHLLPPYLPQTQGITDQPDWES